MPVRQGYHVGREAAMATLPLMHLLTVVLATHTSILAWRILWTEEPGRLQSMGLQRIGYN